MHRMKTGDTESPHRQTNGFDNHGGSELEETNTNSGTEEGSACAARQALLHPSFCERIE